MNKQYEEEYHKMKHNYLYNDEEYYRVRARTSKKDYFKYPLSQSNVLEWGCGLGQNIYYAHNAIGYDKSKFAVDFCKQKGIYATTNLNDLKDNSFSKIICCEVLEHLENPLEELKRMKKKLTPSGLLFLVLPIDKWNKPSYKDNNQHLYNWNPNTIVNLLIRAGYSPCLDYKIIRRTGFYKLLPFSRISFNLYLSLTKLAAIISGSKHMMIIAKNKK